MHMKNTHGCQIFRLSNCIETMGNYGEQWWPTDRPHAHAPLDARWTYINHLYGQILTWVLPVHRCPKAKEACLSTIFCMFNVQISSIHTNRHKVTPCLWKGCVSTSIRYMFILIYKRTTSTPHNVATLNRLICVRWRLVLKPIVTQNTKSHLKVQLVLEH